MTPDKCRWCGNIHGSFCPLVKALEFEADGVTVKRVEFHAPPPIIFNPGRDLPMGARAT